MKTLTILCLVTALGTVPTLAQTYTTTTNQINPDVSVTTTKSSSGSEFTSTSTRQSNGTYSTTSTYVPPPPPSNYQPMKGYCPMGNCK